MHRSKGRRGECTKSRINIANVAGGRRERVNELVNVTGELIVAKNAVGHIAKLAMEANNTLAAVIKDEHVRGLII